MTSHGRIHTLNFIRKLSVTSVLFLGPIHFLALGFNGWQIGTVISLFAAGPLLVAFPTGWTNDRFSIAGVIRAGLAAQTAFLLVLAGVRSFPLAAAVYLGLGVANNVLDISLNSLFYKDESAIDQNRKYGIYVFWTALGPAVGVLGGGYLARAADFRTLFLAFAAATAAAILATRSFDGMTFSAVPLREYGRNFIRPKTLLFVIFLFVLALHWAVEGTVYGPFLRQAYGLDAFGASLYMAAGLFVLSIGAFLFSRLKFDARGNARLLLLCMGMSAAGLALMTVRDIRASLGFRFLHEIGDGGLGVLLTVVISRLFEKRNIGGSAAMILAVGILGQTAGAMILSPLGYRFGLKLPFLITGGLLAANTAYGAWLFRKADY